MLLFVGRVEVGTLYASCNQKGDDTWVLAMWLFMWNVLKERNDKNFKAKNKKRKKLEDEVRVSNKEQGGEERGEEKEEGGGEGKS